MGELNSRVLAALDEAKAKSQVAQESAANTEGILGFFRSVLNSGSSQGDEFDRKAEESKLVSYLEQTSKLLSQIVRVSMLYRRSEIKNLSF